MTEIVKLESIADGFVSPAQDAQAAYRGLLRAMSRPGVLVGMDGHAGLQDVTPAAASILLTLLDFDTTLYLGEELQGGPVEAWIRFHTGCRVTSALSGADFALFVKPPTKEDFQTARQGDPKYPDQSATFIVQVSSFTGGQGVRLEGPGIDGEVRTEVADLGPDFWEAWRANSAQFPLGIDVMLCSGADVIGLPRTSRAKPDA